MSFFKGNSVQPAASQAAQPFFDPVDAVNTPAGSPAQEIWPGSVDPSQYGPGREYAGSTRGEEYGAEGPEPFAESLPITEPGGGYGDQAALSGHDGPMVAWDSSAGEPFAPSGAINPDLHGEDTGGVFNREYVVPAAIGSLTRRTEEGQTYNRVANTQEIIGQTAPNDRRNLDQYQVWDPNGYDPWEIPYSERAILNNVAYEATPVNATDSVYTPSGALSDRSPYSYAAVAYESPADPAVGNAQPDNSGGIGGGWV